MYLNDDQISRPAAPPIVSPCKGIMACFSFIFLGVPRHYARRSYSCWCQACSRVRGPGHGSNSRGAISWSLHKAKPGKWPCVQARELWSPKEETHVHAGQIWLLKFGKVAGSMSCVEKEFKLGARSARSTRGGVSTTVTAPSWLMCGCIEWMRMPQV